MNSSIADYLAENGTLTYSSVGVSMLPLLRQGKDLFTVRRKGPERCKRGDVVLYRRGEQCVLHRVIEVRPNAYVILGDDCVGKEYGVRDADIIGIMTGYVRGGKEHSVQDGSYRVYSWFILRTIGLRIFLKRCKMKLSHRLKRAREQRKA